MPASSSVDTRDHLEFFTGYVLLRLIELALIALQGRRRSCAHSRDTSSGYGLVAPAGLTSNRRFLPRRFSKEIPVGSPVNPSAPPPAFAGSKLPEPLRLPGSEVRPQPASSVRAAPSP